MPIVYGAVGAPSATSSADGANLPIPQGKQGDAIVSELNGPFYTDTLRGNTYWASIGAPGVAFTIFSNASFIGAILWNPQGSGKNVVPIRATVGVNANAATAASGWGYCFLNNTGANIATGAPFSAFTDITATRGSNLISAPGVGNSVVRFATTATLTSAFAWGRVAAFGTATGAVTVQIANNMSEDFLGSMIVPPGSAVALTSAILTGITATASWIWAEKPL